MFREMECAPNAKINLGLRVVSRRPDGYHNLETAFYPIPLHDRLTVEASDTFRFTASGLDVGGDSADNLVCKAYRLLASVYALPSCHLRLRKSIPFGAGLGGGSSDAAFCLKLLNEWAGLGLSLRQMESYASRLGADCAFFVSDKPVMARGVGDEFSALPLSLKGWRLLLVKPEVSVSTADAYRGVTPRRPDDRLEDWLARPVEEWREGVRNDFEESVFAQYPPLADVKRRLYAAGAAYAAMSGSGSCLFGLFRETPDTEAFGADGQVFSLTLD